MTARAMESEVLQPNSALRRVRGQTDMRPIAATAFAAAVAIAIQGLWIPVDADVSWLITVSERVLSGDRLYVDIYEVNPPASVWLYLPLLWVAKLLGARPEAVVVAAFVAAGLASVSATLRLASRLDHAPPPVGLAAATGFVALVLPMALFAQREHAALLLALPALTALAVIAEGKPLGRPALLASGFAAGIIIVIKPYFLPAVVAPALWAAWKRRSLSPLLPGIAAAAAAIGLYAIAVLALAQAYIDYLPVIAHTYGYVRAALWKVAVGPALYPAICLALAYLLRSPRLPALAAVWALGSAGFLLAAIVQAKNYPNHWLPQTGLAFAAAFALLMLQRIAPLRRACVGAALVFVAFNAMDRWSILPDPAVAAAIKRVAPPEPKIIALSAQLTTGHPVTRNVGGHWVGSRAGLFTASAARFFAGNDPVARQAYRDDIQSFPTDVERHSPDVVLAHKPDKTWLMEEPSIARVMAGYRQAAAAGDTEIWLRRRPRG
jgi:hypothetical protein